MNGYFYIALLVCLLLLGSWENIGGVYLCSASRFLDNLETYDHQHFIYR